MRRNKALLLASLALGLAGSAWLAGAALVTDPLDITFTSGDFSDDGGGTYSNGVDGVLAHFPGTGNIVLDPDANAKGKNAVRRFIELDFTKDAGDDGPLQGIHQGSFMSINALGKDCDGSPSSIAPRDMTFVSQCIQADVAVNGIEGSGYLLRCGEDKYGDPARADLDNVWITCDDVVANRCVRWSIAPGGRCALFRLMKGNKFVRVHEDPYDMPFTATVERQ